MRKLPAALIAVTALAAAACAGSPQPHPAAAAGSSPPQISAAAACRDFAAWWAGTRDGAHVTDSAALRKAVSEAPSGQLYADMSAIQAVLKSGTLPPGAVSALARQVTGGDCAAVNPAS